MWAVAVAAARPHELSGVTAWAQCWSVLQLPCDPQLRLPNSAVRLVRHPHTKPTLEELCLAFGFKVFKHLGHAVFTLTP